MSVKLIAFREDTWFAPLAEQQLWQTLANAYGADWQLIRDWSDAVVPEGWAVVITEGSGAESAEYAHPANAVYVFGRTGRNLTEDVPAYDGSVRVTTPVDTSIWGCQAAAIILRDRERLGV